MKKLIAAILTLILCISLCACGDSHEPEKMTPKQAVMDRAEWDVGFKLTANGCKGLPSVQITTIEEVSDNKFEFYGTYSATNEYNETVRGKFEGIGSYDPETEKASVKIDMN